MGTRAGTPVRHPAAPAATAAAGGRRGARGAAGRSTGKGFEAGYRPATDFDLAFALLWMVGWAVRRRRGLSGQVPPPRGPDPAGRGRTRHLHHLRLVLGARPRPDPAARRDRHDGADPAWPALAAEADRDGRASDVRWRGAGQAAAHPRSDAGRRGRHGHDAGRLCDA